MSSSPKVRYQGAIVRDHAILLIQHRWRADGRSAWLIPGGGREPGESEEECVRREMREETGLDVAVERLLLDEAALTTERVYQRYKTYLCRAMAGEARPGYEPEPEAASAYTITAVGWFDLRQDADWDPALKADPISYPLLTRLQRALGYPAA